MSSATHTRPPAAIGVAPPRAPRRGFPTVLGALAIVVVTFAVYWASPVRLETDSFWAVFTARSVIAHGDVDLDEYPGLLHRGHGFQIDEHGGHSYYAVPLATSLAAVPFVAAASVIDAHDLDTRLASGHAQPVDGFAAACIAALAAGMMFLVARRLSPRLWVALATAAVFAFGTQVWSTASRTMWMHGPSLLCLCAGLYCCIRARESRRWCAPLGAVLALAYFVRPTNIVALGIFGVWVLAQGRGPAVRYLIGASAVACGFVALDLAMYGRPLQAYFRATRLGLSGTTVEALVGNLVSPGRGLLVFVPVTLVCAWGFLVKVRSGRLDSLDRAVAGTAVGYWLVVSLFPSWWAGWAYGPRFLTDIAPMLVWFLPPALERLAEQQQLAKRLAVVALVVASCWIQARGALAESTAAWNWRPADVGLQQSRLWDWTDLQILR